MSKTALLADRVVEDRLAALGRGLAHRRSVPRPERRVRFVRHLGALRLVPVAVAAVTLVVGLLGGTAYAFFTATGTGSGSGSVGSLLPVQVEQATVVPGTLFPGQKAGLSLKLYNPNDRSLTLVGVSEAGTGTTVTVTPPTASLSCTGTNATVSIPTTVANGLTGYTLNAKTTATGVTSLTIATGAAMGTASPNACQSKSFHIKVSVKVRS